MGMVSDSWGTRYYCQVHYRKVKELWDIAQDQRELDQWGDKEWFKTSVRVINPQQSLFPAPSE